MAADPTVFPEQVTAPRDHTRDGNLTEGLRPWQPQKLYFFSDTANPSALDGKGPQYPWDEVSPSRNVTYGRLALESIANHRTQDYPGLLAEEALKKNDFGPLKNMKTRLVLGKSLVAGSTTGDVFEGTVAASLPFKRVHGYEPAVKNDLSAELGGSWAFYRQFWRAHDLTGVQEIFPPQMRAEPSAIASIPILVHNDSGEGVTVDISAAVPAGWGAPKGTGRYPLRPHESRAIEISLPTPSTAGVTRKVRVQVSGPPAQIADLAVDVTVGR